MAVVRGGAASVHVDNNRCSRIEVPTGNLYWDGAEAVPFSSDRFGSVADPWCAAARRL